MYRWGGGRILNRVTWFSGGTERGSVFANRIYRRDHRKLTSHRG